MKKLSKWISGLLNIFYPGRMLMIAAGLAFLRWITGKEKTGDALRVVGRWILHNPFGRRVDRWAHQGEEQWSPSEQPIEVA